MKNVKFQTCSNYLPKLLILQIIIIYRPFALNTSSNHPIITPIFRFFSDSPHTNRTFIHKTPVNSILFTLVKILLQYFPPPFTSFFPPIYTLENQKNMTHIYTTILCFLNDSLFAFLQSYTISATNIHTFRTI